MKVLEGLRIIDLTQNVAGPFCTQMLGDLGADVVKIERPGRGDDTRSWVPPYWGESESAAFLAVNRSKRSLTLDVGTPKGLYLLRRLIARADVFIHSLGPGAAERLGLDAERCRAGNPRLIYCAITAFGEQGPLTHLPGYDALMQAYSGLMAATGHPGQPPTRVGASVVDLGTGLWASLGIFAALRQRDLTGNGCTVTASLFESALNWVLYPISSYLGSGQVPRPQGSGMSSISPYQAFSCSDGEIMIAAANDSQFRALCDVLALPDCAADPRFATNASRVQHRDVLVARILEVTRRLSVKDALSALEKGKVPCAPILSIDQVVRQPQVEASGILPFIPTPQAQDFRSVALPLRWDGERAKASRPPPVLGEHSREILREAGLSEQEVAEALGE